MMKRLWEWGNEWARERMHEATNATAMNGKSSEERQSSSSECESNQVKWELFALKLLFLALFVSWMHCFHLINCLEGDSFLFRSSKEMLWHSTLSKSRVRSYKSVKTSCVDATQLGVAVCLITQVICAGRAYHRSSSHRALTIPCVIDHPETLMII